MKHKFIRLYMDIALRVAEMSVAERLKVGTIVVRNGAIISMGYNGTPEGWDNCCEYEEVVGKKSVQYGDLTILEDRTVLKTKPEVIHAEINAIGKLAKLGFSGKDSILFCTHACCIDCAKAIHVSGIKTVYYNEDYRDTVGLDFLKNCGIEVIGPISKMPV